MEKDKGSTIISHDPFIEAEMAESRASEEQALRVEEEYESGSTNCNISTDNCLTLTENLTIQEVSEVYAQIRSAYDNGAELTLDVDELSRVDGAGIQMLCAVFKEAENQHMKIVMSGNSTALQSAATQMGVLDHLQLSINGKG